MHFVCLLTLLFAMLDRVAWTMIGFEDFALAGKITNVGFKEQNNVC